MHLLTGWRRPNAFALAPPREVLDTLDKDVNEVIARALSSDPAKRYQTARELAAALTGTAAAAPPEIPPTPILPFRHLAPLTEVDPRAPARPRDRPRRADRARAVPALP